MIWITIILDIITALPAIINLIKMILAAIHGGNLSLGDRIYHEHEFQGALLNWHLTKDHAALEANLKSMGKALGLAVS